MNIQAMMKQATKMKNDMEKAQKEIANTMYEGNASFVTANLKGTKELVDLKIDIESLDKEDLEMLQDLVVVAVNDAIKKIDKDTEAKMGKFTQGMPGLF